MRGARAASRYGWPLNIRELEQVLAAAVALAPAGAIDAGAPPADRCAPPPGAGDADPAHRSTPRTRGAGRSWSPSCASIGGNVTAVARAMGKARVQIHRWMQPVSAAAGRIYRE